MPAFSIGDLTNVFTDSVTPTDGMGLLYDSGNAKFKPQTISAGANGIISGAVVADNAVIRGDGGSRGVQDSGVLIDDSDNITGVVGLVTSGATSLVTGNSTTLTVGATAKTGSNILDIRAANAVNSDIRFYDASTLKFYHRYASDVLALWDNAATSAIWSYALNATTTWNTGGKSWDFVMKGDTDVALFYLDGSTDRIGISTATPAYVLDVAGTFRASGNSDFSGTLDVAGIVSLNGNTFLGSSSSDVTTCLGTFLARSVNDAGMTLGGTESEVVYNENDSTFYGCTVTHASAATWVAFH